MKTAVAILATAAALAVVGAVTIDSRVQSSTPAFEYLTLRPGVFAESGMSRQRDIYSACQAAEAGWKCRRFEPQEHGGKTTDPLNDALTALGQEHWEMVASFNEPHDTSNRQAFILKRRLD